MKGRKNSQLLGTDITSDLPEDNIVALVDESSLNVNFLTDFEDPSKQEKGRRKKTMEKRKEELSFKHVVDMATASDTEDDEDSSSWTSLTSLDSELPTSLERKKVIDKRFLEYRFFEDVNNAKSKHTKGVKGRQIGYSKKLPTMKRIYPEVKKDVPTASTSKGYNPSNLNKAVLPLKGDEGKQSKSDNENNLDHLANVGILRSKSAERLIRIYEKYKSQEDFVIPSTSRDTFKHKCVVKLGKRIQLSAKSVEEEKSESYKEFQNMEIVNNVIEDVETPSTSKYIDVPRKRLGGVKRILLPEREERSFIERVPNVVKDIELRKKRRALVTREEVTDNAYIYNFFASMADLVSTLPYSATLTAKARITQTLEEMVGRVEKYQSKRLNVTPNTSLDISEEDLKRIKLRLSRLPYIY